MKRIVTMVVLAVLAPSAAWAQASMIRINEFLPDPVTPTPPGTGGDPGFEWIELYNAGTEAVDLTGFRLQKKDSGTTWSGMYTFTATGFPAGGSPTAVDIPIATRTLDPGEYLVIADDETWVPAAHLFKGATGTRTSLAIPNGSTGSGIRLVDAASTPVVLDVVVYAPPNTDNIEDEVSAPATSIAPKPSSGLVLARAPNGVDTDLSGDDFILTATHTMGAANPNKPTCDAGAPGLVINEFLPDPSGTDDQNEYVELYNGAGRDVELDAWTLEWGTSSFSSSLVFADTVEIGAGEHLVIGGTGVPTRSVTHSLTMGNASNADGVRLKDCAGTVVDTVIYGGPNDGATPWGDDAVSPATSLAPFAASQAIARRLDGVDTNLSGDDFQATATLTPGAANPAPGVCTTDQDRVVINEFLPNPAGTDSGNEWVELFNRGSTAIRVDGWTIRVATSSDSYAVKTTLPTGLEIPAGGRILVGEANVPNTQATGSLAMGGGTGADGVRLVDCAGNVADTVVYGDGGNGDGVVDDAGLPAISVAPKPGDGQSLARKRDGVDTDQSGEDFAATSNPTPGAANPELICIQNTGNVKLNEFLPDPDGADGEAATEFIELYNAGSAAVDLDGWQLILSGAGDDKTVDIVLPPGSRIPAETWFVIGNANVADADATLEFSIGNGTGGDAIYLLDCTGAMVDAVAYGPDNTDLVTDESNAVATVAGNPGESRSLARVDDGVDSNAAADWFVDSTPTPGATNFQEGISLPPDDEGGCKRDGPPDDDAPEGGCSTVPMSMGGMALLPLLFAIRRRRG